MYPANAANFKIGKGGLYASLWPNSTTPPDADLLGIRIGNCTDVRIEPGDLQSLEKFSSTQATAPLVDRRNLRQTVSVVCVCDEHTKDNLEMFFMGTQSAAAQGAQVGATKDLFAVEQGKTYNVGAFYVSNVDVVADGSVIAVEGADYEIYPLHGDIYIVPGGAILDGMDLLVTFDQAARSIAKVVFASDDSNVDGTTAKGRLTVWKSQVQPDGQYGLVQDEYGNFTLRFTVVDEPIEHAGEPYKIEYPEAA